MGIIEREKQLVQKQGGRTPEEKSLSRRMASTDASVASAIVGGNIIHPL